MYRAVIGITLILASLGARSAPVTFQATGELYTVNLTRPNDPLAAAFGPSVMVGDAVTVTYIFDDSSHDLVTDTTDGRYQNLISRVDVIIDTAILTLFPMQICGNCHSMINLFNDFTGGGGFWDQYAIEAAYSTGGSNYLLRLRLFNASMTPSLAMTSDQLLAIPPNPLAFSGDRFGSLSAGLAGGPSLEFQLSSMSAVPVPAAAWLLGSALGVLGWVRLSGLLPRRAEHHLAGHSELAR